MGNKQAGQAMIALLGLTFLFFASFNTLLSTFPVYAASLGYSQRVVGLLGGLFAFAAVLERPFLARLTDSKGRKFVLAIAALASVVGPLLYGASDSLWFLTGARIVHAVSLSAYVVASQTLMADLAPQAKRGFWMGLYVVVSGLPAVLFPPIGFYLLDYVSPWALFLLASALGGLMIPTLAIIKEPKTDTTIRTPEVSSGSLLRNRNVWAAAAAIFAATVVLGGVNTFLPLYGRELGIGNIGVYFTVFALLFMAGSALAGRLADVIGRKTVVVPAFLLVAVSMLVLLRSQGLPGILTAAAINGLGFAALQTLLLVFTVDSTGVEQRARAVSFFNNSFDLGFSFGGIALGFAAARSYGLLWSLLLGLAMLGFLLTLRFLKEPGSEMEDSTNSTA